MTPVDDTPLWGSSTQLAVENFAISGWRVAAPVVRSLALIKQSVAHERGLDDPEPKWDAIVAAAREVVAGLHDDQFPVDVFQTGSGTSTNMNVNEVVATLAARRVDVEVHPNDDVNFAQSSNDAFPTAVHLGVLEMHRATLRPAIDRLVAALADKSVEFRDVVKAGRTHLMDATPVTLGQEFGGHAHQLRSAADVLDDAADRLCELPLGGTATGTGLGAPAGFAERVIRRLATETGFALVETRDHFALQGARDQLVTYSAALRGVAIASYKIANDIRLLASGPRTGLAEIHLPSLQPGSSIMPGKVNPVLCETVTQVAAHVFGNDAAVAFAGTQGALELNTYAPMIAHNVIEAMSLLANACTAFADRTVGGIEANTEVCQTNAERTLAIATALNPIIGYDRAAEIVKEADRTGATLRSVLEARGLLPDPALEAALDPARLADPHRTTP